MNGSAVDASALIAFLRREPGAEVVAEHLRGAYISAVNLCEVLEKTPKSDHSNDRVLALLHNWQVDIIPFDIGQAVVSSLLKGQIENKYDISFADRACLALAVSRTIPAITADRAWKSLAIGADVILIRGEFN